MNVPQVVFTAFVNLLTVAWTMVGVAVYVVDLRFTRFEGPHVAQVSLPPITQ